MYITLIVSLSMAQLAMGNLQRMVVKGKLMCGDKPAAGVDVKLVDKDVISDDVMDKKSTGANGEFLLDGTEDELTKIDPVLKIYHDCDDGWKPCQRRWSITIPDKYISKPGDANPKTFDLGVVNLEARIEEDRNCV
uniref:Transthyretin-like family protein n=1 Tax=Trichuris muris TaxID=70415 RepID=A0A5S6QX10_TRIMR